MNVFVLLTLGYFKYVSSCQNDQDSIVRPMYYITLSWALIRVETSIKYHNVQDKMMCRKFEMFLIFSFYTADYDAFVWMQV